MGHFLEPLLHDLAERFRFLDEELACLRLPPEAESCRRRILDRIQRDRRRIDGVLRDPDIGRPDFAKNFYHAYKRMSEFAQQVDEGPLFALSRFRREDRFLSRVVGTACGEFGFPHETPICVAMSSQYYCAMPRMDLILVPHGEATHLLGWADLYHELAHFILARNQFGLLRPLRRRVRTHFQTAIDDARRTGWTTRALDELAVFRNLWLGDWIIEFACDFFATFAAGTSFGWSNLRLCARMSGDVFVAESSHPADAARTQAILVMLESLHGSEDAEAVRSKWQELLGTIGGTEPQTFRIAYPEPLIRELALEAIFCFEASGLRRYRPGVAPLADRLNEAWKMFQANPRGYCAWEAEQLRKMRAEFDMTWASDNVD
jgi:hypothetical protein